MNHSIGVGWKVYLGLYKQIPVICVTSGQTPGWRGRRSINRIVVMPDYQGLGIMRTVVNQIAALETAQHFKISLTSSNPAIFHALKNDPKWFLRHLGRHSSPNVKSKDGRSMLKTSSASRVTYCFEFKKQP